MMKTLFLTLCALLFSAASASAQAIHSRSAVIASNTPIPTLIADQGIDQRRVIPVIRQKNYIPKLRTELRQRLTAEGRKQVSFPAFENYNDELILLYAEVKEDSMSFLSEEGLTGIGYSKMERRAKAAKNIRAMLGIIEMRGADGTYIFDTDGNEASLLLYEKFWHDKAYPSVRGEPVIAVPSRDTLLITGSEDTAGQEELRRIVSKVIKKGEFIISDRLFVYRDGTFVLFD